MGRATLEDYLMLTTSLEADLLPFLEHFAESDDPTTWDVMSDFLLERGEDVLADGCRWIKASGRRPTYHISERYPLWQWASASSDSLIGNWCKSTDDSDYILCMVPLYIGEYLLRIPTWYLGHDTVSTAYIALLVSWLSLTDDIRHDLWQHPCITQASEEKE